MKTALVETKWKNVRTNEEIVRPGLSHPAPLASSESWVLLGAFVGGTYSIKKTSLAVHLRDWRPGRLWNLLEAWVRTTWLGTMTCYALFAVLVGLWVIFSGSHGK